MGRAPLFPQAVCIPDGQPCSPSGLCCSGLCSSGLCGGVDTGGSALDGFDPNANGTIRAVVVQPDGKILIGGDFTTLSPNGNSIARNQIARLNSDGTIDDAFNPNANGGVVYAIALQADGKILVGGVFSSIGGQPRRDLARLSPVTGAADSFDPNPNSDVLSIAVQTDGKILVGGDFNQSNGTPTIGGQTRNNIARLDPMTDQADSFNPNANSTVDAIVVQADGKILVGGLFFGASSIGGQPRNHIARLNDATGLADSFDPNANSNVYAIALQADGKILVGGLFIGASSIGGQPRNHIARLDPVTGGADSFNPNANGEVDAIAVQPDGKILAGGLFTGPSSIGSQPRSRIARLDAAGVPDSFNPTASGPVLVIAVQPDGKILAGGQFTTVAPNGGATVTRNHVARLESDGRLDQTLDLNVAGGSGSPFVIATAVQGDGKILIGGNFSNVLSVPRNNIARLNTDGTLDTAFDPNSNGVVHAITVQADGQILVGGDFNAPGGTNSIGGATRNRIARLDATTGAADSFDPNADNSVRSIAVQSDGKILAGGSFASIGGQPRNNIARLDATTGAADSSFNPNASGSVRSIAMQADGKILVSGDFNGPNSIGGAKRNFIARLDATSGAADSFDPDANGIVRSIVVQTDGQILAGGDFNAPAGANSIGGATRNRIARLDAINGTADSLFDPNANEAVAAIALQADGKILASGIFHGTNSIGGATRDYIARLDATTGAADSFNPNANNFVYAIAVEEDGKILAGGTFAGEVEDVKGIGGQARNLFARLSNDTAALQNLAVTQTTISWTHGGSSPQFARVTFESSTDKANYALVGNGTPAGSNWTLTGLSLPTGQNFFIRARGYYGSGQQNGSASIAESVRNAFIPPVLRIVSITRPTNGHIVLQCLGVANRVNDLEASSDLSPGSFMTVSPLPPAANATGAFQYNDAGAVGLTKRFYRLLFP